MRGYEVKLYFKGSEVFYIDAPDEEEAIDLAHEELANMHEFDNLEVIDSESCEDDDPEGEW
jgi:hypothetical protein